MGDFELSVSAREVVLGDEGANVDTEGAADLMSEGRRGGDEEEQVKIEGDGETELSAFHIDGDVFRGRKKRVKGALLENGGGERGERVERIGAIEEGVGA